MAPKKSKSIAYAKTRNGTLKAETSCASKVKSSHQRKIAAMKRSVYNLGTEFRSASIAVVVMSGRSKRILICSSRCAQGDTIWDRCMEEAMQKAIIKKTYDPESEFGGLDGELEVHFLSAAELLQRGEVSGILAPNQIRELTNLAAKVMKEKKGE